MEKIGIYSKIKDVLKINYWKLQYEDDFFIANLVESKFSASESFQKPRTVKKPLHSSLKSKTAKKMLCCVQNMVRKMISKKHLLRFYDSVCVRTWMKNKFEWYICMDCTRLLCVQYWSSDMNCVLIDICITWRKILLYFFLTCFHTHCHHGVFVCVLFFQYYIFYYTLILFYLLHNCDFLWYTSPVTPKDVAFWTHLYTK